MKTFLCALLWSVFALLAVDKAFADAPITSTEYRSQSYNAAGSYYATGQLACDAAKAERKWNAAVTFGAMQCQWRTTNDPASSIWETTQVTTRTVSKCADGSAPDTTKPLASQCGGPLPADPNCPAGMRVFTWAVPETPGLPAQPICMPDGDPATTIPTIPDSQCSYKNPTTGKCEAACPNGSYFGQVPTGAWACIKSDTGQLNTDSLPKDCPTGYMNISASGTPNCTKVETTQKGLPTAPPGTQKPTVPPTPPTSSTTEKAPTTTTNADGSTTTTKQTTTTNRDGSTTTTTETTNTDANGNTTTSTSSTTGKTPSGVDGVSDSQKNDQTDLCIRHPELNVCKNSAVTQADCSATVCTGDAIQCAALRQSIAQACEAKKVSDAIKGSAQKTLGDALLAGNDPDASKLPTKGNGGTWAMPSSLDQSGWLGGGSCFSDKSFTVQGHTVVIPFSKTCDYLIVFRYVAMVIASLVAFKLLSGTILMRT